MSKASEAVASTGRGADEDICAAAAGLRCGGAGEGFGAWTAGVRGCVGVGGRRDGTEVDVEGCEGEVWCEGRIRML